MWLRPPNDSAIIEQALPSLQEGELEVRTCFSAVSRGTETLVYTGAVPASEYARMRAPFQEGELPGPVKHGYANVGVVEAGPGEWLGRAVFCLYPHQTRYRVAADAVIALPDDVPPERAILAANMETAVNALWDAAPGVGDRITVIGAGVVGGLVASLCARLPGADIELVDIDPRKAGLGDALGVRFVTPAQASGARDLVIHASASEAGLAQALALAGFEATVLEMSWHGSREVRVPLGQAFHSQRLMLRSSQVGAVSPTHRARWDHRRRLILALSLLADARFDALIDAEAPFESLPEVMARLARPDDATLCQRIRYR
ncbi:zinc-dependent alcohol dehydrogenase [Salinisphaera aquimarina]|uniref:Zinc-binding alcohol dehydrogenase n=1 Tax=Salinisphaera aquimarina TaxID=2094031 RepID=A0ABV7EPB6_9GAMM